MLSARTSSAASKTSLPTTPELLSPFASLKVSWDLLPSVPLALVESIPTRRGGSREGKSALLSGSIYIVKPEKKSENPKASVLAAETVIKIIRGSHLACVPSVASLCPRATLP